MHTVNLRTWRPHSWYLGAHPEYVLRRWVARASVSWYYWSSHPEYGVWGWATPYAKKHYCCYCRGGPPHSTKYKAILYQSETTLEYMEELFKRFALFPGAHL